MIYCAFKELMRSDIDLKTHLAPVSAFPKFDTILHCYFEANIRFLRDLNYTAI